MTWGYVLKLRTEVLSDSITMKNAKLLEMFMQKLVMLKNQTSKLESQVWSSGEAVVHLGAVPALLQFNVIDFSID